jgi:hypothetical protein
MTRPFRKAVTGLAIASTVALTAAPADAQRYRRHHHNDNDTAAWAIGAGILGLGIGAAIASSNRNRYYDRYGGYYDRGYAYAPRRAYSRRCATRWEYDPYYGDYVRVRYC